MGQAAFARWRVGQVVGAPAAQVVLVLGNVGQLQEVAEGAHHHLRLRLRQRIEQRGHAGARFGVVVPRKLDGGAPHLLDQLVQGLAFLLAQRVAQQAAEQADVVAQRGVLVQRRVSGGVRRRSGHGCVQVGRGGVVTIIADRAQAANRHPPKIRRCNP